MRYGKDSAANKRRNNRQRTRLTRSLVELREIFRRWFVLVYDAIQILLIRLLLLGEPQVFLRDLLIEFPEKRSVKRERDEGKGKTFLTSSFDRVHVDKLRQFRRARSSVDTIPRLFVSHSISFSKKKTTLTRHTKEGRTR